MHAEPITPHINGVQLVDSCEQVEETELRQRACTELLRQAAITADLLDDNDPPPLSGAISPQASQAIEQLLERELNVPEPDEQTSRRHYDTHPSRYAVGERVQARHVLFAVTPGVDVNALRSRAEACLLDLRCPSPGDGDRFAEVAAELSNCPSGSHGGNLGWLTETECAPEFASALFGQPDIGVLAQLVHSRFGLHVVEVLAREPGMVPSFETVHQTVAQTLQRQRFAPTLRQYLQVLAAQV